MAPAEFRYQAIVPHAERRTETEPSPSWHPVAVRLFRHWQDAAAKGPVGRSFFDPLDWKDAIQNIWMLDVVEPEQRLRFRLVGGAVEAEIGMNPVGRFVEEVFPSIRDNEGFWRRYREVIEIGRPLWTIGPPDLRPDNLTYAIENLSLPYFDAGGRISGLIMAAFFHRRRIAHED